MNSFNPCYLGNTIRSLWTETHMCEHPQVSILVILEIQSDHSWQSQEWVMSLSFNPCYLGNTIRSVGAYSLKRNYTSFNPCYLGNTIRSHSIYQAFHIPDVFQSLLSWKYNQILNARVVCLTCLCFNPCYLGNTIRS